MRTPALCLLALVAFAGPAQAWEIKTTGEGLPIRWPDGEIVIDLSMGAESFAISQELGDQEVGAAFDAWQSAARGHVTFAYQPTGSQALPTKRDGRNVIRWGTESDDPFVDSEALATTYLTYRTSTGEALEADIVVNALDYEWSTGDCNQRYDLRNVLAHEAGHFVGLAHSQERDSTMFPSAGRCETQKRELSGDDREATAYLYENLRLEGAANPDLIAGCGMAGGGAGLFCAFLVGLFVWRLRSRKELSPPQEEVVVDQATVKRALTRARAPRPVHRKMRWLALMTLGVALPSSAHGSAARTLAPDVLHARAALVVQGQVVKQEVRMEGGWPVTVSHLAVAHCDRKHCPARVEVKQLGGELGELGLVVSGVRHLASGGDYVLFLEERDHGYRPVAKAQGIFQILGSGSQGVLRRDLGARYQERSTGPAGPCESDDLENAGRACQPLPSRNLESLSWTQFEEIFGAKLLK